MYRKNFCSGLENYFGMIVTRIVIKVRGRVTKT